MTSMAFFSRQCHTWCRRPCNTPFGGVAEICSVIRIRRHSAVETPGLGLGGLGANEHILQLDRNFHAFPSTSFVPLSTSRLSSRSAIRNSSKPLEIQTFHLLTSKGLVKQNFHPRMTHENPLDATTLVIVRSECTSDLRKWQDVVEGVKGVCFLTR